MSCPLTVWTGIELGIGREDVEHLFILGSERENLHAFAMRTNSGRCEDPPQGWLTVDWITEFSAHLLSELSEDAHLSISTCPHP